LKTRRVVICTNTDQNLIADKRNISDQNLIAEKNNISGSTFRAKYFENGEKTEK